jgi:hypothetical protein
MKALSEGTLDILAELNADATPSMAEQVADWAGIPLDDVTESDCMKFFDSMRQDAEEGWGTP